MVVIRGQKDYTCTSLAIKMSLNKDSSPIMSLMEEISGFFYTITASFYEHKKDHPSFIPVVRKKNQGNQESLNPLIVRTLISPQL